MSGYGSIFVTFIAAQFYFFVVIHIIIKQKPACRIESRNIFV